jgi:hypothetical protein
MRTRIKNILSREKKQLQKERVEAKSENLIKKFLLFEMKEKN